MAFTTKYLIFVFSYFTILLVQLAKKISAKTSPESLPLGFMIGQGIIQSKNLYLIHNTAFANLAN